ncbi:hypothetical protein ALC60_12955 [Trachymyrmex zeteki]|uniref:Uncharacterized protein n=1 Tax=Mycetomoellerius zeteki TaxID=64791 RepID=A0A151WJH8_9HYME|nr:hypothetical protein ALC60_12955 [Trachymyrmex zeteki]
MTGDYSVRGCAIAVGGAASRSLHLCKRASGATEQRTRTRRPRKRGSVIDCGRVGGPLGHVDTTHFYAMSSARWAAAVVPREDPLFMLLYAGAGRSTTARWAE